MEGEEGAEMVALKKAYAEIILNTAKEAAARVMASERKARRFQHDLRNTKDEAFRLFLRLKDMIDAKTTEAEITSMSQQRRIEELDAQLNEAEGVILDLRAELRKANDQLKQVESSHMQQSNGPLENTAYKKKLDITETFRSSAQCSTCCNPPKETATSGPGVDNIFVNNPNVASIITRSQEPKLYRNECTHRLQSIERNPFDEKVLAEDIPDRDICTKKELIINRDERHSVKCAPFSIEDEKTYRKNLDGSEALSINGSSAKEQPVRVQRLPRSSVRYAQSNPKHSRFRHCQSIKPTTKSEKVNIKEHSFEQDEKLTKNNDQSACTLRRSLRKRKARCWDGISSLFKSCAALSRCKKYSCDDSMKSGECKYKSKPTVEIKQAVVPTSASVNATGETKVGKLSGLPWIDVVEDAEFIHQSFVGKHEVAAKKASEVSSCNLITEANKVLTTGSVLTESYGDAASDADKNRVLKYTFSRKRKRNLLSESDNCSSVVKSFMTGKMGERPNVSAKVEKPSLIEDPSSDSQNMVEIACQLISLSGKDRR